MATMKNYFGTLNSADDHLLRDAISANNYDYYIVVTFLQLVINKKC